MVLAAVAAVAGALVALHYHRLDLTLSHYDARGHLVVARRILDSITPGWQQIGAVWLPLPHLLNALPVQVDAWYRSGASAVAISVASFALASGAIAWIVLTLTGCAPAAVAAAAVFAINPNVLYLQATPMTEPLLIGLTTLSVAMLIAWTEKPDLKVRPTSVGRTFRSAGVRPVGIAFALACLTRYEAWPVTAVALTAGVWAVWRRGTPLGGAVTSVARIAAWPIAAIVGFLIFSRVVVGAWWVGTGFFVPENKALHDPLMAADEIGWGLRALSGSPLTDVAIVGAIAVAVLGFTRRRPEAWIALSFAATAAVPWVAFLQGHPFRVRYMVPLIAAQAVFTGVLAGVLAPTRRWRLLAALALAVLAVYELRPLDLNAPMVVEAQWDRPNLAVRDKVTACLGAPGSGKIMASMGSLGHYMQEASQQGFAIRDFLHEGNGDIWLAALAEGPRNFAEWVLIEEKAEGGDMLAAVARERPGFLNGYVRVCEGAGLALYRRQH